MQQIISITDARNNLSQLVAGVAKKQQSVIIVRDSVPEAILVPYIKSLRDEQVNQKLWEFRWKKIIKEGKKTGRQWAKKNNINLKKVSEAELYGFVKRIKTV